VMVLRKEDIRKAGTCNGTTHRKRKKTYTRIINQGEYSNLHVIRLKSPKETKELLKNMEKNVAL